MFLVLELTPPAAEGVARRQQRSAHAWMKTDSIMIDQSLYRSSQTKSHNIIVNFEKKGRSLLKVYPAVGQLTVRRQMSASYSYGSCKQCRSIYCDELYRVILNYTPEVISERQHSKSSLSTSLSVGVEPPLPAAEAVAASYMTDASSLEGASFNVS